MKLKPKNGGFTLIELLVVVAIIALLAVGVFPYYTKIMLEMKAKNAMKSAYQIHQMLFGYAQNHDQEFPSKDAEGNDVSDSNTAFRELFIAGSCDDEKLFYVQGSAYCPKAPDAEIGKAEDGFTKALEVGENHWAYVKGLSTDRDESTLPIIADGFASPGKYTDDQKAKGGAWKGRYAAVVRIAGNAKVYTLDTSFTVKDKKGGTDVDIFSDAYGTTTANIVNPL